MELFVHPQELHALEVTGLETVAQSKAHVASLEGRTLEDKVMLLAGSPLQDEATLGEVDALTTLEVVGCMLGGEWGHRGPKPVTLRHIVCLAQCLTFFCFSSQYLKVS
uniref:Ubiquitin-like domain-containing protein n=1 Tax=Prolemur simus TaxID=1328070 RepID=A0A8C9AYZ7_PROSS